MTKKSSLVSLLVLFSAPIFAQGLTKSDLPYYKQSIKQSPQLVKKVPDQEPVISADTIVAERWKSILYSYERLKYLKENGLITLKEMEDKEAKLLMEVQKLRSIRSSRVHTIGATL